MTGDDSYAAPRAGSGVVIAALVLVVCATMPVYARPVSAGAGASGEDTARAMLVRTNQAAATTSYQGMRLVSARTAAGQTTVLIEIKHVPERGTVVRVMGAGDRETAVMYERRARSRGRGIAGATLELLIDHYRVAFVGTKSCAGRKAHVIEARRGDGSLAARFWLDRETGLLLRREIYDRRGRVMRESVFIELDMESPTQMRDAPPAMPPPWRHRLNAGELRELRARGWTVPRTLPGGLTLVDARRGAADGHDVVHLSYSDGLFMVSLFVQRGSLAHRRLDGWQQATLRDCCVVYRQHTIPRRVMWSANGQVYTLVADAPPQVVRRVVTTLPHAGESEGFWGRMMQGFGQLGTWLNPFE